MPNKQTRASCWYYRCSIFKFTPPSPSLIPFLQLNKTTRIPDIGNRNIWITWACDECQSPSQMMSLLVLVRYSCNHLCTWDGFSSQTYSDSLCHLDDTCAIPNYPQNTSLKKKQPGKFIDSSIPSPFRESLPFFPL